MKIPIVYVSHSLGEVARLATDIVMLEAGKLVASGPASEFLARLDLLPEAERGEGGALIELAVTGQDERFGLTVLRARGGEWRLPRLDLPVGAKVRARVRARDITLATARPQGFSALNVLPCRIVGVTEGEGAEALVRLDCGGDTLVAQVTRYSVEALALAPERDVFAVVKAVTFDRAGIGRSAGRD